MTKAVVTCGMLETIIFVIALVSGTLCSLCSKVMLTMKSVGITGELETFDNP